MNSLGRLHSLTKNLIRSNKFGEYVKIIQEQINEGIFERKPVEMKKIIGGGYQLWNTVEKFSFQTV